MKRCIVLVVMLAALFASSLRAAENEVLLCGFEKDDVMKWWAAEVKVKVTDTDYGYLLTGKYHDGGNEPQGLDWGGRKMRSGDVTQGTFALCFPRKGGTIPFEKLRTRHRGEGVVRRRYGLFAWSSHFANAKKPEIFPPFKADWTGHDYLRLDVKPLKGRAVIVIWIEDEEIEPQIRRVFPVPAGQWQTLQVDLAAEAKARGLDIKRMRNLVIAVREDSVTGDILFDNFRISKKTAKAKYKLISPDPKLEVDYALQHLKPGKDVTAKECPPDRSKVTLGAPIIIDTGQRSARRDFLSSGGVAAYDNKRILVLWFWDARQTVDGGKTWTSVKSPGVVAWSDGKLRKDIRWWSCGDGSTRSAFVDSGANMRPLAESGCCGIQPGDRLFTMKISFKGKEGWEYRPECMITGDLRHCSTALTQTRLPGGRLWAAWGEVGRQQRREVHAKYSDDDGLTWHSWQKGKVAIIPGSRDSDIGYATYANIMPAVTACGKHAACFWQDKRGLVWSAFDGKKWGTIKVIDKSAANSPSRNTQGPCAVTLANGAILLTAPKVAGVLRYDGKGWKKELQNLPAQGSSRNYLTRCGEDVLLFALLENTGQKRGVSHTKVDCYRRDKKGGWSSPRKIIRANKPLGSSWSTPFLHVPVNSPPNFAPVIWAYKRETKIQLLKVPVDM